MNELYTFVAPLFYRLVKSSDLLYNVKRYDYYNPLSPKSGQHQISPCNINAL